MPDILLRDKLWGPLSWGKLSSFFLVVSALMCFDPWVWELPSLTLLRYMALTFHILPYLIIPTHSYRTLSLTLFHPNDFFPCPRLPNNTYPPLLYRVQTYLILFHPTRSLVYHTQPVSLIPYSIFIKYFPILSYWNWTESIHGRNVSDQYTIKIYPGRKVPAETTQTLLFAQPKCWNHFDWFTVPFFG